MEAIKTVNMTKSYGKSRGVIDLNLSVQDGEFFGFIGPNGAGKSTTIRTLLGLIKITSGSASVLGKDIVSSKKDILSDVGYLPSEAVFYSKMRVSDAIKFSADLRKKDCQNEAERLCERLQLDTAKKIDELSFGNRKKVSIVCALQHDPRLLVLDEPTSGLDPLMQREFFSILQERNKKGVTVFLSSHVLSEIQRYCTRAAIIKEGKIIACDSVEKLAQTSAKRVNIHGENIDLDTFSGVRDLHKSSGNMSFLYSGDINDLIEKLSSCRISDLTITEPDLEEVFMHYYVEGSENI